MSLINIEEKMFTDRYNDSSVKLSLHMYLFLSGEVDHGLNKTGPQNSLELKFLVKEYKLRIQTWNLIKMYNLHKKQATKYNIFLSTEFLNIKTYIWCEF